MIVTYNWLKEFVDFNCDPVELADLLTMLGLEVERIDSLGAGMDDVVVAVIEEKKQHPNADKLSLCVVDNGSDHLSIVCGAQNMHVGDKVALAQIGAVLPGDFKIKRSKIRGEESFGMLCSEKELGLAEESAGIMILTPEYEVGAPLFKALGMQDTVYEIGLTPNRADCLSVVGVAREVAAKLGTKLLYRTHSVQESASPATDLATVIVEDSDYCPRYTARFISGCTIAPSPQWLVNRLQAVGMRSINNVVDITNYVLMEYGHPLHAFDFSRLAGGTVIVRRARDGELFTTLDGQERVLTSADLTIRDQDKAIALAGIMGGENSEISQDTTDILLESAYFDPSAVRRTSKRLGLHTESSHRFERGADIEVLPRALDRAASLIAELSGGTVAQGMIDNYPRPFAERVIRVRLEYIKRVLGIEVATDEAEAIFRNLECSVTHAEPGVLTVHVPSFRVDLEREIDLVEEIVRLKGYDTIPATMPQARVFSDMQTREQKMEYSLRELMVAQGFNETINFSFIAADAVDKLLLPVADPRRNAIPLRNPISDEMSVMRTMLLPGLIDVAAKNISHRQLNLSLFEIGRVYLRRAGLELPDEPLWVAGLLSGLRAPAGWNQGKDSVDFYDVKGVVENILHQFNIGGATFNRSAVEPFFHPGKSCHVVIAGEAVGYLGELHPDVQEGYGLESPVYCFELNFQKLVTLGSVQQTVFTPPSRYPETFRDIAMLADDETEAQTLLKAVSDLALRDMKGVELFDLYRGDTIPQGKKSIAIRVRYQSHERTLNDDEVNRMHQKVITSLTEKFNVTIR